jgi:APA family basic amino acid/polyamine antiporter
VVYTEWIFFGLMAVGLVLLRRRPDYTPRYRVWGYPALPLLFALASGLVVLNQLVSDPVESAFGLAVVALGFPVYRYWSRHAHR